MSTLNYPPDTPYKAGLASMMQQSMAADETRKVKNELGKFFYALDTKVFLDTFLPVDQSDLNNVEVKLKSSNVGYNTTKKRWKRFPKAHDSEEKLYEAFLNVAKVINSHAGSHCKQGAMKGQWVDCHNKVPRTQDTLAAAIRPDVAFVSTHTDPVKLNEHGDRTVELGTMLRAQRSTRAKRSELIQVCWLSLRYRQTC
jgi:hypothetical protein